MKMQKVADTAKSRGLEEKIEAFLSARKFAVLSTVGNGQPYASLVAFAVADGLKTLVFASGEATRKLANIRSNNRIALMVENSTNAENDIRDAMAATVLGTAEVAGADEREVLAGIYLSKHPYLAGFLKSPGCILVKFEVETYVVVEHFQQAVTLQISR